MQRARLSERQSWREWWCDWRERLLSSDEFQRMAAKLPFARTIARRRAAQLFDLCAGFVYSQTLLACVQLRVFEQLRGRPQTLAELAQALELPALAAARLTDAAIALRLLEHRSHDRIGLGPHGAVLLANEAVRAMIAHHPMLYVDMIDPVALLRGPSTRTRLSEFWAYAAAPRPADLTEAHVASYSELMAASQPLVADDVLDAYRMAGHRCLMDVGGGEGEFALRAAARNRDLRCMVFDVPAVAARASRRFAETECRARLAAAGGDFLTDPLPKGADLISLIRVIHDHDDPAAMRLLSAVFAALPDGGALLIAEPLAASETAHRGVDAYFSFYLFAMGAGRMRTASVLKQMLQTAGFKGIREATVRRPWQVRVLVAHKPKRSEKLTSQTVSVS